jgi:hypothetical protein
VDGLDSGQDDEPDAIQCHSCFRLFVDDAAFNGHYCIQVEQLPVLEPSAFNGDSEEESIADVSTYDMYLTLCFSLLLSWSQSSRTLMLRTKTIRRWMLRHWYLPQTTTESARKLMLHFVQLLTLFLVMVTWRPFRGGSSPALSAPLTAFNNRTNGLKTKWTEILIVGAEVRTEWRQLKEFVS